jgi:hypothetical protein
MRYKIGIIITAFVLIIAGCTKTTWDDHYTKVPDTINTNVWDAIKSRSDLSRFVDLMVKYKFDSLFKSNDTYTLFIPDNNAIDKLMQSTDIDATILNYHISRYFVQPVDIQGKRKLQTLEEKFSTFESVGGNSTYDGVPITFESPLYLNGKFFVMGEVALPKPNLYEYFAKNNSYLKAYIDSKDSIILDKVKSRPIGFDANGNTVYDTVSIKTNEIDSLFFPMSKEFRASTATFVFPRQASYEAGLTEMAQKLGGTFSDYKTIPVKWQEEILIPHLLKHGTFLNMLEANEFKTIDILTKRKKYNMVNIHGDSIVVNYVPTDKYLCSNGVTYDYKNFSIPDSLFSGTVKIEGESLTKPKGTVYIWKIPGVSASSSPSTFDPNVNYIKGTSNDSVLLVKFTKGYAGTFNLRFHTKDMFPRKYRMVVTTHMDYGGIYDIYVNDVKVTSFDYYLYIKNRGIIPSVDGTKFSPLKEGGGRFNRFDCYVNNITEYGKAVIRFEYKGPGTLIPNNGLAIDLIEFIPVP